MKLLHTIIIFWPNSNNVLTTQKFILQMYYLQVLKIKRITYCYVYETNFSHRTIAFIWKVSYLCLHCNHLVSFSVFQRQISLCLKRGMKYGYFIPLAHINDIVIFKTQFIFNCSILGVVTSTNPAHGSATVYSLLLPRVKAYLIASLPEDSRPPASSALWPPPAG